MRALVSCALLGGVVWNRLDCDSATTRLSWLGLAPSKVAMVLKVRPSSAETFPGTQY